MISIWKRRLSHLLRRFGSDRGGNVALIFALSSTALVLAAGGGIDLVRAYNASQKLTEVADLACQYASRPSIIQTATSSYTGSNGGATYVNNVKSFIATSLTSQKYEWTQTNATPFSYVSGGAASVSLTSAVPTLFAGLINIQTIPINAAAHCYDSASSIAQIMPTNSAPYIVREGFESTTVCNSSVCYINKNGANGSVPAPAVPNTNNGTYTGQYGNIWVIGGYCIETDQVGLIKSTVPEGVRSAELDCDNGSGTAGNSSLSTNVYLSSGSYELRYNYASRVDYPNYDPAYICGTTAGDVVWANDTYSPTGPVQTALRTNQMNVYLDLNSTGSPPVHTTLDGKQQLGGSNLIDTCVYAPNWIERSVRINVATAGFYWLSFAADGQNDSFGAQLDNMRLCQGTCPGTVSDSFPTAWQGTKLLFEDNFESPVYSPDPNRTIAKAGNVNNSLGKTASANGCTGYPGWPCQKTIGWAAAPYNQITYNLKGAAEGSQYIDLDGWNGLSSGSLSRNRMVSRPFLLDPGYYQVAYNYISDVDFGSTAGVYGSHCYAAPKSGYIFPSSYSSLTGAVKNYQNITTDGSTNIVGAFMSHSGLVSTPNTSTTAGSTTTYNNPDGSVSTTATAPADNVNYSNYDGTAYNPLLDTCGYTDSYKWVPRSINFTIAKPGMYWLTFSANGGLADGNGGGIDDVKLTALGSLYGAAPSTPVAIPTPAPASGSSLSFGNGGFTITANPLTVPAP